MTTLQPQPSSYLQSTLLEDQMELSPGPGVGDDIDIDLDLDAAPPNDQDNDYIIEDARPEDIAERMGPSIEAGNDDVMHDGDHTFTDDQERDVEFHDEELYNTHDQTLTDDISNNRRHSEYVPNLTMFGENGSSHSPRLSAPEDLAATDSEHQEINYTEDRTSNSGDSKNLTTEREAPTSNAQEVEAAPVTKQPPALSGHNALGSNQEDGDHEQAVSLDERSVQSVQATSSDGNDEDDDALTDTYEEEESNEPKDPPSGVAHIHPVVVIYEGNEISLFPPFKDDTSDTFFLPDESLARANICDLFEAIRSVLAGSISEDDELNTTVECLGLELSEDSIHARTTTLSQIVDLYVQLFRQDGVDEPDPLYMTLTTKVRFSKRFNEISSAAADGKGISQLPFWHGGGQDYGDYPTENTSHSEDIDHHPGWEADYASHRGSQSPAKDLENPDAIGSRGTGDHAALSLTATDRKDPQELIGATRSSIPRTSSDVAESARANNDEAHEVQRSSAKIATDGLPEEGHSQDEPVVDTDHQETVQETTSYQAEDELRDDDLIDYDDDDDGAGQYTSTGSSTLQSDDRRTSNEAEYAAINAVASRRNPVNDLSHESLNDTPQDSTHSENEQEDDFVQPGVSGYEEDYEQYNDEDNDDDGSQQYGGEAEHTQSELYEDSERYTENAHLNEYTGFQESTENEYAPENWNSTAWHPEEQAIIGDNREEYYQQDDVQGDGSEGVHPEGSRYVSEHTNLDLHFDEEGEERAVHDSQRDGPDQTNGSGHATSGISASIDTSGEQYLGETGKSTGVGEDEALYDDDDVLSDTFYDRDGSVGTPDSGQAASQAHRDSTKRTLDEAEDTGILEGDRQDSKRMRSR
ncbi:hypothetical protein GP486_005469 [Trichoglossum hirsutum]|uniref:Uncharacterized protein n=1 Tax=Trichoglossum hirsutum TaxID=265104 RepID=A0A9P8L969_9PEZI|nr:hypothetical protein GP486_005469 [Trichoglossum hirsutum]